ncbi:MAG: CPBP family glutamic-type intramembrane protease, partial [Bacteroidota bacterium]
MDSSKLALEFILFAFAIILSIKYRKVKINQYLLWTITIGTLITNIALFYLNIDFLTATYYSKASQFYKYFLINIEITKWTVLSYTITRFNLSIKDRVHSKIGFVIDDGNFNILKIFSIGLIAAIIAAISVYFVLFAYYWTGIINVNPIKIMQPIVESMRQFAFFGGIRNLFGEEIIARLGVQTLILYYLGDRKFHVSLAIILSSFFFFLWHDGIGNLNPANFISSLIFGI